MRPQCSTRRQQMSVKEMNVAHLNVHRYPQKTLRPGSGIHRYLQTSWEPSANPVQEHRTHTATDQQVGRLDQSATYEEILVTVAHLTVNVRLGDHMICQMQGCQVETAVGSFVIQHLSLSSAAIVGRGGNLPVSAGQCSSEQYLPTTRKMALSAV